MFENVVVVIPSYEPDHRLSEVVRSVYESGFENIVVVNDGSDPELYGHFFDEIKSSHCVVLRHDYNMGKGHALKTAFSYIISHYPSVIGCITVDSDGQHAASDIVAVAECLSQSPDSLILGCRQFDGDVPFKSKAGNNITRGVFRLFCGMDISDTQTGLRGLPVDFMRRCLEISYDRFEYETEMLLVAKEECVPVREVVIETIYDSKEHHSTHFNAVKDSVRIYRVIFGRFFKYALVSLSSCALDLLLFTFFSMNAKNSVDIMCAVVFARFISAIYNYMLNYRLVFESNETHIISGCKYFFLAVLNLCLSGFIVTGVTSFIGYGPVRILVKAVVDTCIFFLNYIIQKKFVFNSAR